MTFICCSNELEVRVFDGLTACDGLVEDLLDPV